MQVARHLSNAGLGVENDAVHSALLLVDQRDCGNFCACFGLGIELHSLRLVLEPWHVNAGSESEALEDAAYFASALTGFKNGLIHLHRLAVLSTIGTTCFKDLAHQRLIREKFF